MLMNVNELFSVPIGLKPAIEIDGTKFFSSPKLKASFSLAFTKSSKGRSVAKEVTALVEKDIIVPCYKSKNLFSFIKKKLVKGDFSDYILAFYNVDEKRVIVIIDNNVSIFGTAANNSLVSTTMHECMHLSAGKNIRGFLRYFDSYLQKYYSAFFTDYFKLRDISQNQVDEFIKYITKYEIRGPSYADRDLGNYFRFLEELLKGNSDLENQDFQVRLTQYIVATKLFIKSPNTLFKNYKRFSMIFTSLNRAYWEAFGEKNKYTTPIQELISLSEVACVLSEMKPTEAVIKKLFQNAK
jgi:hypothetical protein